MIQTGAGERVVVIGGGLAGISAAVELGEAGLPVTLLEARPWLGGATCSFTRRGLTIDNGQHAFLRCFTAYRDLLAKLASSGSAAIQDRLDVTVVAPGAHARIRRSSLPAPLHLARPLARYRLLSVPERARVAAAGVMLQFSDLPGSRADEESLGDWMSAHGQREHARRLFWDVMAVPLLNIASGDADLGLAVSAIRKTLLTQRDSADIGVPSAPLSRVHGGPAADLLARLGAEVLVGVRAAAVQAIPGGRYQVQLASAGPDAPNGGHGTPDVIDAAAVVLAVPPWEAAVLATAGMAEATGHWAQLLPSPVVSIHVIYGSRVTTLPFAVAAGSPIRWWIDKTHSAGLHTGQYLAAAVPAAGQYVDKSATQLRNELLPALEQLLPAAADADIEDFFVTRERRATVAQVAGSRRFRPPAGAGPAGFAVAGAWTDTGWPETMEGAVRSGLAAARKLIAELAVAGAVASPGLAVGSAPVGSARRTVVTDPASVTEPPAVADPAPVIEATAIAGATAVTEPRAGAEATEARGIADATVVTAPIAGNEAEASGATATPEPTAGRDEEGNDAPQKQELPGIAELEELVTVRRRADRTGSAGAEPLRAARR